MTPKEWTHTIPYWHDLNRGYGRFRAPSHTHPNHWALQNLSATTILQLERHQWKRNLGLSIQKSLSRHLQESPAA